MSAFTQDYAACPGANANYIEAAVAGELGKLIGRPPGSQDVTMIAVALALAGVVKGWHLDEAEIRQRFIDAVLALQCKGEPWTRKHALYKWQRAAGGGAARLATRAIIASERCRASSRARG